MDDDLELIQEANERLREARQHWSEWRVQAKEDYDFAVGEQWSESDKQQLIDQLRPCVTFDRIGPIVAAVSGSEVNNRQEVRFIPREMGDVGVNEVLTGTAKWVRDECDAEDEESDSFIDTIICGLGVTETAMSYDDDEEGNIVINRVDPLELYPDPFARKRNLSDGKRLHRVKMMTEEQLEATWPNEAENVINSTGNTTEEDDDVPVDEVSPGDNYDIPDTQGESVSRKRYRVIEYQWCEYQDVYKVADPQTNQMVEFPKAKFDKLEKQANQFGVGLKSAKQKRRVWQRMFYCGEVLLTSEPCPCPYSSTYKFITGKRDRNKGTWFGLVRTMKDPQRWGNKFFSTILHQIATSGKGIMAEDDAFPSWRKAEEEFAKADAILKLKKGAIAGQKVSPKPAAQFPAGLPDMLQFAISSIRDVSGVNLELLGMADRQQAGILEAQRKQAGLTILAGLFDSLRRYRKEQGRVLLHFIQEYISDGRLVKIVGQEGEQYIPLVRQPQTAKYDVIVDDAPTSPNQKEQVWGILQAMMPILMKQPLPAQMWVELLKYSPLPESLSSKMGEILTQPNPQAEQAQQVEMEQKTADVEKTHSETAKNLATAGKAQADVKIQAAQTLFGAMTPQPMQ